MAGYVTVGNNIYNGAHKAAEPLTNGTFVYIYSDDTVKKLAASADTIMRVAEKEELWGNDAVRLDVVSVGADEVFFVENEWDVNTDAAYDASRYTCNTGDFVKMKRLLPGEQVIMSVGTSLYSSLSVGALVQPVSTGVIAAYTPVVEGGGGGGGAEGGGGSGTT